MLTTDRVAAAGLALVAVVVLGESRRLPLGSLRNPGPGYLPVVLGLLLLGLALLIAFTGTRATRLVDLGWQEWRHALAIFAVCAFAAWALERLGYRLTTTVSLLFLLIGVERKGLVLGVAVTLALAFGSFFLFNTVLRVPLPRGPFGL